MIVLLHMLDGIDVLILTSSIPPDLGINLTGILTRIYDYAR